MWLPKTESEMVRAVQSGDAIWKARDAARSASSGKMGLGLTICKALVEA